MNLPKDNQPKPDRYATYPDLPSAELAADPNGGALPVLPQDNEGLRKKLEAICRDAFDEGRRYQEARDKDRAMRYIYSGYQHGESVLALFQAEQTRLKAELIAKLRESLPTDEVVTSKYGYLSDEKKFGFRIAINEIIIILDTLERGA